MKEIKNCILSTGVPPLLEEQPLIDTGTFTVAPGVPVAVPTVKVGCAFNPITTARIRENDKRIFFI